MSEVERRMLIRERIADVNDRLRAKDCKVTVGYLYENEEETKVSYHLSIPCPFSKKLLPYRHTATFRNEEGVEEFYEWLLKTRPYLHLDYRRFA